MPDFIFDGQNRLIIEPAGSGDTNFNVGRDLYSAWQRWVQSDAGAPWLEAFSVEGGTPIGSTGSFTGSTFLLVNGWKVRGADHDHQLILSGNIFSDDGIVSSANPDFNVEVFVSASVNAQGVSTAGADPAAVAAAVWGFDLEDGEAALEMMRLMRSALIGKASGANSETMRFRDASDTKDRITASVDRFGNREAIVTDPA